MSVSIRCAVGDDAESVRGIYEPVVLDTAISFETLVPTASEMRGRIERTLDRLPWLVCEQDGKVLGYAYAGPHRAREAYQWSVEFSAFVHPTARRRGVGTGLYRSLAAIVRRQGYRNAYAGITLPNDGSLRLHESFGFRPVGVYSDVGFKNGQWHSVSWWQLRLSDSKDAPSSPLPLRVVQNLDDWPDLLSAGVDSVAS